MQTGGEHPRAPGWLAALGLAAVMVAAGEALVARVGPDGAVALRGGAAAAAVLAGGLLAALLSARAELRAARGALDRAEAGARLAQAAEADAQRRVAALPFVVYGGVARRDGTFAFAHVGDNAPAILGWDAEALLRGGDWRPLMAAPDAARQATFLEEALAAGGGRREFRLRRPEGGWIWVRDSLRVLEPRADGSAEMVGCVADLSEERTVQAGAQENARLAALGEMATGLAHELNQPLAVMSLAAENAMRALQRRGPAALPDVQERLGRISQQARRARDIVEHLRAFGHPAEGALEPVPPGSAVEGAVLLTNAALRAAGIAVTVDLPHDLPRVMARLTALEQALVNLLLNARDAIEQRRGEGTPPGQVRIAARRQGGRVLLTVADNGGGIPETAMDRLFEPFFTTKPPGQGTGLGLPAVHAAMRSFGGTVAAANSDEGAVFTLSFEAAGEGRPADI
ncbi:sensor histidine kinase, partial [Falsiroseomonas sp. CW058]|uniref:sensor histidine kinase n=1 Tax=Falsiroseomonas sp. CW058 TaxID=3388664 RepID=UPI003D323A3F